MCGPFAGGESPYKRYLCFQGKASQIQAAFLRGGSSVARPAPTARLPLLTPATARRSGAPLPRG